MPTVRLTPSTPSRRTTSPSRPQPLLLLAYDADAAGAAAGTRSAQFLPLLDGWGHSRNPREPISNALSGLERELASHAVLEAFYDSIQLPAAANLATQHGEAWQAIYEYWCVLREDDADTLHSKCSTADEYVAASEPLPVGPAMSIDFAAIKERVDVTEYISNFTPLRKSGSHYIGRCPLPGHEDSTPSLWVYPATRSWYCFGCQEGGDVIRFAQLTGTRARDLAAPG